MQTIYKYELAIADETMVRLPEGAQVLSVGVGPYTRLLFMWALVDPDARLVGRRFRVVGTGNSCPLVSADEFVGTVVAPPFVWHVFEAV